MPLSWLDAAPPWPSLPRLLDPTSYLVAAWMFTAVALLLLLTLTVFALRLARVHAAGQGAARQGERSSVVDRDTLPLTCFFRDGTKGDPLNLRIVATEAQLGAAFVEAGWFRADEITLVTSFRITVDSLQARQYSTAPMSNLYLYGRRQDYGFQKPGASVRERDHVRLWDSGLRAADGRPLWLGAATRDVDVKLSPRTHLPTHRIAPDVDAERELVAGNLAQAGWVLEQDYVSRAGEPTVDEKAYGDLYFTDGMVAVLVLADVPVLLPFADDVRGPALGLARRLSPLLRGRLPRRAVERARQVRERVRQRHITGRRDVA
jgi:hypothetical protein